MSPESAPVANLIILMYSASTLLSVGDCGSDNHRSSRHNLVRDHIFELCRSAHLNPTKEPNNLISDRNARPADVYIPSWDLSRPAALDVTIVSPVQDHYLSQATEKACVAANAADQEKHNKAFEYCLAANVDFFPLAFEIYGAMTKDAKELIKRVSNRAATARNISRNKAFKEIMQKISLSIAKANALAILHRREFL